MFTENKKRYRYARNRAQIIRGEKKRRMYAQSLDEIEKALSEKNIRKSHKNVKDGRQGSKNIKQSV